MRDLTDLECAVVSGGDDATYTFTQTTTFTRTVDYPPGTGGLADRAGFPAEGTYSVTFARGSTIKGPDRDGNGRPDIMDDYYKTSTHIKTVDHGPEQAIEVGME